MKSLLPIINLCLAAGVIVGLVLILRMVLRLRRAAAAPSPRGNRWNADGYEDLGDLTGGVTIGSNPGGTTMTRGGRVIYQSKGNRVTIDKRGRIKGSRI